MKRKLKQSSGLFAYLDSTGVLATGNEEAIALARKEYWRNYKRMWRKEKRKKTKEIAITFSKEELKIITQFAKQHQGNRTALIKASVFGYLNKRYIIPAPETMNSIKQLLGMHYNIMEQFLDENMLSQQIGNELKQKILELERTVLVTLHNPKTLEQWIVDEVHKEPAMKIKLLNFINSL